IISGDREVAHVRYRNGSEQPVYKCSVCVLTNDDQSSVEEAWHALGDIGPNEESEVEIVAPRGREPDLRRPTAEISFTDSRGRLWVREQDGLLVELGRGLKELEARK